MENEHGDGRVHERSPTRWKVVTQNLSSCRGTGPVPREYEDVRFGHEFGRRQEV